MALSFQPVYLTIFFLICSCFSAIACDHNNNNDLPDWKRIDNNNNDLIIDTNDASTAIQLPVSASPSLETSSNLRTASADLPTVTIDGAQQEALSRTPATIASFPVDIPLSIVEDSYTALGMKKEFFEDGAVPITLTLIDLVYGGVQPTSEVKIITKVANTVRYGFKFVPEADGITFTVTQVSPGGSTLMMGSPAQMSAERKLGEFMEKVYAFRLINDGQTRSVLFMSGMGFSRLTFRSQAQSNLQLEFPVDTNLRLDSASYRVNGIPASFDHSGTPVMIELTNVETADTKVTMTVIGKVMNTQRFDVELMRKPNGNNVYAVTAVYPIGSTRIGTPMDVSVAERKLNDFIGRLQEMQLSDPSLQSNIASRVVGRSRSIIGHLLEAAFVQDGSSTSPVKSFVMDANSYKVKESDSSEYKTEPITDGVYPPVPMIWKKSPIQHTFAHTVYTVTVTPADQWVFEIMINELTSKPTAKFVSTQKVVDRLTFQQSEVQTKVVGDIRDVTSLSMAGSSITFTSPSAMLTFVPSPFTTLTALTSESAATTVEAVESTETNSRRRLQGTSMTPDQGSTSMTPDQGSTSMTPDQGSTSMTPDQGSTSMTGSEGGTTWTELPPPSIEEVHNTFLFEVPLSLDPQSYTVGGVPTEFFESKEDSIDVELAVTDIEFDGKDGSITFMSRVLNIQIFSMTFTVDHETDSCIVGINQGGISTLMGGPTSYMNTERRLALFMGHVYKFQFINDATDEAFKSLLFYSTVDGQLLAELRFTNLVVSTPTNLSGSTSMEPASSSRRLQGTSMTLADSIETSHPQGTSMTLADPTETSYPQGSSNNWDVSTPSEASDAIINKYPSGETTWFPPSNDFGQLQSFVDVPLWIDPSSYVIMGMPTEFFQNGEYVDVTLTISKLQYNGVNGEVSFFTKVLNTQVFDAKFQPDFGNDQRSFSLTAVYPGTSTRMIGTPAQSAAEKTLADFMHRIYGFILINDPITNTRGIKFFSKLPTGFAQLKFLSTKPASSSRHLVADPNSYRIRSNGFVQGELFEGPPFTIPMTWTKLTTQSAIGYTIYHAVVTPAHQFTFEIKINDLTNEATSTYVGTETFGLRPTFAQSEVQQKIFQLFNSITIVVVSTNNIGVMSYDAQLTFNNV